MTIPEEGRQPPWEANPRGGTLRRGARGGMLLALVLLASGCFSMGGGPTSGERRAPCDRLAAQAIDTDDLDEARRLAARAADCYAELRGG